MRIVLITCPAYGVLHPPLSLALLAAVLRNCGHEVVSLDLSIQLFNDLSGEKKEIYWDLNRSDLWQDKGSIEKLVGKERITQWLETIIRTKPDMVGFSIYGTNLCTSLILAEKIKAKNNRIHIIFGGPFARRENGIAESIINHTYVDSVVVGEGETTLQELVGFYEKKGKLEYCKGAFIRIGGKIVDCGVRQPIPDLNSLPFPDFSDFNFNIYKEKLIPILASRSCLYKCAFCNEKSFWQEYRWRTADNIIREVKYLVSKYGISTIRFNDLMLNGKLTELEKFCDRIIHDGIKIRWGGYITVRKMEKNLIEKMRQAGCYFIFVGIESGSQNILDRFKKGVKIEVAEELLRSLSEVGISAHTGWIVGFPDESFSDFKQTIDFIKKNRVYMERVAPANLMSIPPGSPIFNKPIMFGVRHVVHAEEYVDSTTTLKIRKARLNYFNMYMASA